MLRCIHTICPQSSRFNGDPLCLPHVYSRSAQPGVKGRTHSIRKIYSNSMREEKVLHTSLENALCD